MTDEYLNLLIEQRIAELSDDEFDQLCAKTRPPRLNPVEAAKIAAAEAFRTYRP